MWIACTLTFNPGPPDAVGLNVAIAPAMVIFAKDGDGNPLAWNGVVTWGLLPQAGAGAGSVSGDPTPTCVNPLTGGTCSAYSYDSVKITDGTIGGSYKLTATASIGAAAGPTVATSATAFTLWGGILGCDAATRKAGDLDTSALKSYALASDVGKWGLTRGSNKENAGCVAVPYTFVLDILSSPQKASFIVPDPQDPPFQKVAVEYVVVWGRVAVDSTGDDALWTTKRPLLSWGTPAIPVDGTNDFVPALACVKDPVDPIEYPNGFASVLQADLDALLPVIPSVPPFSTPQSTTCPNCIFGNSQYPQYQPGQKAKMCVAQQGWTSAGKPTTGPNAGKTVLQYWHKVIDQADGFMSLDN